MSCAADNRRWATRRQPGGPRLVLLLAFSPLLIASPPTPTDYLARFDSDGDGRVSLAEYQAHLSRGFARMDRNRDGRIDESEWPQPGNRALSWDAHQRNLAATFRRQDVNADHFLDLSELTAPLR